MSVRNRPQLSHFTGQKVTEVENNAHNTYGHAITLESDATIYSSRKVDEKIVGKTLILVAMGEEDTTLHFADLDEHNSIVPDSEFVVELNPLKYFIETDEFKPFNPQSGEEDWELPP